MPFSLGDSAVGYRFIFSIDGIECPSVTDVSGLSIEVEKIESKSQTHDGKYIISHMPGAHKPGEITITRQLTNDKTIINWLDSVIKGQITQARKTAKVEILDFDSSPVKTYEFSNVWCTKVETSDYKAGSNDAMSEKFTLTWTEAKVS